MGWSDNHSRVVYRIQILSSNPLDVLTVNGSNELWILLREILSQLEKFGCQQKLGHVLVRLEFKNEAPGEKILGCRQFLGGDSVGGQIFYFRQQSVQSLLPVFRRGADKGYKRPRVKPAGVGYAAVGAVGEDLVHHEASWEFDW